MTTPGPLDDEQNARAEAFTIAAQAIEPYRKNLVGRYSTLTPPKERGGITGAVLKAFQGNSDIPAKAFESETPVAAEFIMDAARWIVGEEGK